jgi:hypothetical protein
MAFGERLNRLWRLRIGVVVSILVAFGAAVLSVERVTLLPFSMTPRSFEMASASTHVVVDRPTSTLLDLRADTYSLEGLTNRTVILGNVMASGPVRTAIARRIGIPAQALRVTAPLTREQPAARVEDGKEPAAGDILKTGEEYRLSIQANPTVPVLDVYTQTPTAESAALLANTAVDELRAYVKRLAVSEKTTSSNEIQLMQLGRAEGAVINGGIRWQVAILAFLITFFVTCATVIFLDRVRRGWQLAAEAEAMAAPLRS